MFDRYLFFHTVRDSVFNSVETQRQVDGCNTILDAWEKWQPDKPKEWLAYILATAFHETARTMQPIEELGRGKGHGYGAPTGEWHQIYDGRGYVQLTWEKNYGFATARLRNLGIIGLDVDFERNPNLAMRPDLAAAILIYGMVEGWFSGKELDDYIDPADFPRYAREDFIDARPIVNGHDRAQLIASYAMAFLPALRQVAVP